MRRGRQKSEQETIDIKEMIALEEELQGLKESRGIMGKPKLWMKVGDAIADRTGRRQPVRVNRRTYIKLALFTGWAGGHRFYTKQYSLGVLYLLFCWSGVPFCMTIVDLMIALPMRADEQGMVLL